MKSLRMFYDSIIDHTQYKCLSSDDKIVPIKQNPKSNDSLYSFLEFLKTPKF